MTRRTWLDMCRVALIVAALPLAGCSDGTSGAPGAPSGVPAGSSGANPDGSLLKVSKPTLQAPTNFHRLEAFEAQFHFAASQPRHVQVALDHQLQITTEAGTPIHTANLPAGQTQYTFNGAMERDTTYVWRVRGSYQGQPGPWSDHATFVTPATPAVTPETLEAYLIEFSRGNANWAGCAAGSGVSCFRFVYEVVRSMNPTCDPNSWGLLSKNPGEQQCTLDRCGPLGGEGFGEDVVTHGGWSPILLWDIIGGAGAPGARLQASPIPRDGRRPGNNWACPWR